MSLVSDALSAGFGELLDQCGESVIVNGVTHECVARSVERGTVLDIGGFDEDVVAAFECLLSAMLTADSTLVTVDSTLYTVDMTGRRPIAGMTCTFQGTEYRISRVVIDPAYTRVLFHCMSDDR